MVQDTLLGFPAHPLHPQGVCSIRKAAQPLTAALPYRRGEFATLLTVSRPARITVPGVLHFAKCWWLKMWSEQKQW